MSSETELVMSIWETVHDYVPASKRSEVAKDILYAFADFGFTSSDLVDVVDEDPDLTEAYSDVFDSEERYDEDE